MWPTIRRFNRHLNAQDPIWVLTHVALPSSLVFIPATALLLGTVFRRDAASPTLQQLSRMSPGSLTILVHQSVRHLVLFTLARLWVQSSIQELVDLAIHSNWMRQLL
jgi:hypothetical protein